MGIIGVDLRLAGEWLRFSDDQRLRGAATINKSEEGRARPVRREPLKPTKEPTKKPDPSTEEPWTPPVDPIRRDPRYRRSSLDPGRVIPKMAFPIVRISSGNVPLGKATLGSAHEPMGHIPREHRDVVRKCRKDLIELQDNIVSMRTRWPLPKKKLRRLRESLDEVGDALEALNVGKRTALATVKAAQTIRLAQRLLGRPRPLFWFQTAVTVEGLIQEAIDWLEGRKEQSQRIGNRTILLRSGSEVMFPGESWSPGKDIVVRFAHPGLVSSAPEDVSSEPKLRPRTMRTRLGRE